VFSVVNFSIFIFTTDTTEITDVLTDFSNPGSSGTKENTKAHKGYMTDLIQYRIKYFMSLVKQNQLTAKVAEGLRKDRKELIISDLTLRTLCILGVLCG
jgi:hypothetical protein